jgi:hypothetical protein
MADDLTPTELAVLSDAIDTGYLVASGRRLQVLRAFKAHCRQQNRPAVIVRYGKRDGSVWIEDRRVWTGRRDLAELEARKLAGAPGTGALHRSA